MNRPRQQLLFGSGLDRSTGKGAVEPASMEDLRNCLLFDGKAQLRYGHQLSAVITVNAVAATDILGIFALRVKQQGVVVAWDSAANKIGVSTINALGSTPTEVANMAGPSGLSSPPRYLGAEVYRRVFLAHDEPTYTLRANTIFYDSTTATPGSIGNLYADGTTGAISTTVSANFVKFRGVCRYLSYLVGWGWGTPVGSDQDRPEVVRISKPGDPLNFDPEHYFYAGSRSEPVVACVPTQGTLLVFKQTEVFKIDGYDRSTFGIVPVDPFFGLASSRLAAVVGDTCYFWSVEGPRMTNGGPSVDLSIPLDLDAPDPASLVAQGLLVDGFAVFHPARRLIKFIFGKRAYVLHLRDPQNPRWSYEETALNLFCGGPLYSGMAVNTSTTGSGSGSPIGYPLLGTPTFTATTITAGWTDTSAIGDEAVEVWLKVGAGAWNKVMESTVGHGSVTLTSAHGVIAGTSHQVAMRYRRGGLFTASPVYTGVSPDSWDATALSNSKKTVTTLAGCSPPTGFSWSSVTLDTIAGKTYVTDHFTWTQGEFTTGSTFELFYSETDDFATATLWDSGPAATVTSSMERLQDLHIPPQNFYFWVRHKLSDDTASVEVGSVTADFSGSA